ncbi:winged helix-turn-helix domain-containing protein [Kitasatospora sp. NPDC086791]|uniref:winged helix-turn-helix domain-containing protein n=1 Tax=Kitasatospora sp. NPDC086791 TaxID=3155178 RepID=UPI00343AFE02
MVVRRPRLDAVFSDHAPAPVRRTAATGTATIVTGAGTGSGTATGTGLVVDTEQRTVIVDGHPLTPLPYLEFELLAHLVGNPLRVHSRRQLMEAVWGRPDTGESRTVATHIARIRRKLGPGHREAIATVRQIGYKYDPRLARAA